MTVAVESLKIIQEQLQQNMAPGDQFRFLQKYRVLQK